MAAFAGKGVAALALTGTYASTQLAGATLTARQSGARVRVSMDYITLDAAANSGAVMKLGWVPYGATIIDGYITHGATDTSVTVKGGVIGVSGTTYDNNDDIFFTALACATAAESRSAPKRLQVMTPVADEASTLPSAGYKVTDPLGAHVILTTAGAANGSTAAKFYACIQYVMD